VINEEEKARARLVDELRSRGNLAMGRDDLQAAWGFYTEALHSEGLTGIDELKLRGNRAACLLQMGHHEAAAADACAALRLDHTQAKNHFRLGSALSEMGDLAGALNSFRAARCFDQDNPEIERRIDALERQLPSSDGEEEEAGQSEQAGRSADSLDPSRAAIPPATTAAEAPLIADLATRPAAPGAPHRDDVANARAQCEDLRLRANAVFKAGDMDKARRLYTRALGCVEEAYGGRSTVVAKGKPTPAAQLYANRCQAALALGDVGGALQDARWACDAAPDWPKAHFRLGSVFLHKKQFADAYGALKRASHLDPKNEELIEACRQAREKMLGAKGVIDHFAREHDAKITARARLEQPDTGTGQVGAAPSAPTQSSMLTELRHALEHVGTRETSADALKLRVWLPDGVGMAAVDLQVSSDVVVLTVAEAGIEMRVPLPTPVRDSEATASFSKKTGVLTVNMPVSEVPAGAVAILV
jgi:tetratricopeptide (TPR) repeat protein